jgi:hypothetical protein
MSGRTSEEIRSKFLHYEYCGQVMRVLFTAQDSQTIRDAFDRAKPNTEYSRLYAAAVVRRAARVEAGNVDDRHGAAARITSRSIKAAATHA